MDSNYEIPKLSADERLGRSREVVREFSKETIKIMKVSRDMQQKQLRFSKAVSQLERIEKLLASNPGSHVLNDKEAMEFNWSLERQFLLKERIMQPAEKYLQKKLQNSDKAARDLMKLEYQYYIQCYRKKESECDEKRRDITKNFKKLITIYVLNYDVEGS